MTNRIEVITGTERRRSHSEEFKAKLVQLALAPNANNSAIARQHGITPGLLFKWKKNHMLHFKGCSTETAPALPAAGFAKLVADAPSEVDRELYIHCGDDLIIELSDGIDPRRLAMIVKAIRSVACVR